MALTPDDVPAEPRKKHCGELLNHPAHPYRRLGEDRACPGGSAALLFRRQDRPTEEDRQLLRKTLQDPRKAAQPATLTKTARTAEDGTVELRDRIGSTLRDAFDTAIAAEWICCDPVRPDHELCSQADAMRKAVRGLLTDDPDYDIPLMRSAVLDALMGEIRHLRVTALEPRPEPGVCGASPNSTDGVSALRIPVSDDDLRAQIASALTAEHYRRAHEQIVASPEEHQAACADAVMDSIRPLLMDALRPEIATLTERAERAEQELAENTGVLQALRRQRDEAEGKRDRYRTAWWSARIRAANMAAILENFPDAHARLRLIEDGDPDGCADWCYPCRLDALTERAEQAERERDEYRHRCADYESAICFETTCIRCARDLDEFARLQAVIDRYRTAWWSARIGRARARESLAAKALALTRAAEERDQLAYERRLLGTARVTLDLVAAGGPERWDEARKGAEDIAQRIVDEIGHPVTDEPALGPTYRAQLQEAQLGWARASIDNTNLSVRHEAAIRRWDALAKKLYAAWWSARIGRARAREAARSWQDNCIVIGGEREQAKAALRAATQAIRNAEAEFRGDDPGAAWERLGDWHRTHGDAGDGHEDCAHCDSILAGVGAYWVGLGETAEAAVQRVRQGLDWLIANGFGARGDTLAELRDQTEPTAPQSYATCATCGSPIRYHEGKWFHPVGHGGVHEAVPDNTPPEGTGAPHQIPDGQPPAEHLRLEDLTADHTTRRTAYWNVYAPPGESTSRDDVITELRRRAERAERELAQLRNAEPVAVQLMTRLDTARDLMAYLDEQITVLTEFHPVIGDAFRHSYERLAAVLDLPPREEEEETSAP